MVFLVGDNMLECWFLMFLRKYVGSIFGRIVGEFVLG